MEKPEPQIRTYGINHITLATSDLARSIDFYRNILGLTLVTSWDKGAYFLAGNLWFCLNYDPKTKKKPTEEYSHLAFTIKLADFAAIKQTVIENKIPIWQENSSPGESLYILDPDNNKLELHTSTLQERLSWMQQKL